MVGVGWGAALAAVIVTVAMAGGASAQATDRPWLGVSTQEITTDLREGLDYRGSGVLVSNVVADSPADRAGLETGDVLVSLNSRTIDTPSGLVEVVRAARIGQSVTLVIIRDGQRRTLTARLAARPEAEDEYRDVPTPRAPRAPRAPKSPTAPRARTFQWDGDSFELPDFGGMTLLGRGRLGVHIQSLKPDLADALGVPGRRGVLVTDVVEDSPAATAGIKGGDVIVEVGGRAVDDVADLRRELRSHEGRVSVTLVRRGARRTVEPDIGDRQQVIRRRIVGDGHRELIRDPDLRRKIEGDSSREDLEQEMRQLREELRELRRKMEAGERP
ncbi:MAG: PDZ domain-containing protein [Candidatus Eiseniibacteriota bacterium]